MLSNLLFLAILCAALIVTFCAVCAVYYAVLRITGRDMLRDFSRMMGVE